MAAHTKTPESCWFCLWDGYGWLHDSCIKAVEFRQAGEVVPLGSSFAGGSEWARLTPALREAVLKAPRVHLPNRDYLLFEGPLAGATELGWHLADGTFVPQSPILFWPDDRAWCVASEIDLFCTLVAGSNAVAERLLAELRLEAWRVSADDPVASDSDDINR